jgi:hypothetical protein
VVSRCLPDYESYKYPLCLRNRIRKKARYQELLDCETKLNAVSQLEELNALRCSCLEQFLSIRQEMLRCTNNGGDENVAVSPHPDSPQNNASKEVSPVERLVQKVDFSTLLSQLTVESMQFKVIPASIGGVSIDWCVVSIFVKYRALILAVGKTLTPCFLFCNSRAIVLFQS